MEQKGTSKWFKRKKILKTTKKSVRSKDVEKGIAKEEDTHSFASTISPVPLKAKEDTEVKNDVLNKKIPKRFSIERRKLGLVPFDVDIDDLNTLLPNLKEIPFCDTMPVVSVNYLTKERFGIKAKLDELIEKEIQDKLNGKGPFHTMFERLVAKITVDNQIEKKEVKVGYKEKLKKAVQLVDNKRLLFLMDLYSFDLPCECPNNFMDQRQDSKLQNSRRYREGNKLMYEYLKSSSSALYNYFLLEILSTNNVSTSNLTDEHSLFTTRFSYAKVTLESLRDTIKSYFPEKKDLTNKEIEQSEKEEESKIVRDHDFIRFETNDRLMSPKKQRDYYVMLLDESTFVAIEIVRNLLLFMYSNITEEVSEKDTGLGDAQMNLHPDRHLAHDTRIFESVINNIPSKVGVKKTKLESKIKKRLDAFVEIMKEKNVMISASVLETDNLLNKLWNNIVNVLKQLNSADAAFIAETRYGRSGQLHNSASFIARNYFHKIICCVQSCLVTFLTNSYNDLPGNWENSVQLVKVKLDILIDKAFVHHMKDSAIATLSLLGLKELKVSEFGRRLNEPVEAATIRDIISHSISLIKYKMLVGVPYLSPLYQKLVEDMKKYVSEIRTDETFYEKESPENKKNSIADETSDIIEKEILLRYMYIQPQLECLQKVAEIGADLVLDIGMKKSRRDCLI